MGCGIGAQCMYLIRMETIGGYSVMRAKFHSLFFFIFAGWSMIRKCLRTFFFILKTRAYMENCGVSSTGGVVSGCGLFT